MSRDDLDKLLVIPGSVKLNESIIRTRYDVYIFAYNFAKNFIKDCRRYREFCDKAKDPHRKQGHLLNEMQRSMACFIFCNICLEAYINTYAGDRLSELIWERLERIRLEDKWIIVPKLILDKTFETDKEPYKSLKWLVDQRNFIVHYKGKFSKLEIDRLGTFNDRVFKEFTLESAEKAFQLIKDMIKTLHSFDGSIDPKWLI